MSDEAANEQPNVKEEATPFGVPNGFFNMNLVLKLYLALLVLIGINTYGQFFYGEQSVPTESWIYLGLYVAEIVLWAIGLQLWARVWVVGYWWIFSLAHLGFLGAVIGAITDPEGRVINGGKSLLILIFLLTNVWSREVFSFFKKSNGKCPLCQGTSCGEPKKNKRWTCSACHSTLIWCEVEA